MMERVGDRWLKMEGYCSTGQSPTWAGLPVEEEEEEFDSNWRQTGRCMIDVMLLISHFSLCGNK
jgi:hypothetical protein